MERLGIISGTLLGNAFTFPNSRERIVKNEYGKALVYLSDDVVLLPRHKGVTGEYILPHQINHAANMLALKELGVREVIGIGSTGSLKKHISSSSIVMPDDFLTLYPLPTTLENVATHLVPSFDSFVRAELIEAAISNKVNFFDGGNYWQVAGPRFETKAEIAMMASFADIVGMTIASEASLCTELKLQYAAICSVDNYANGIGEKPLRAEEIADNAKNNADGVVTVIYAYSKTFNTRRDRAKIHKL